MSKSTTVPVFDGHPVRAQRDRAGKLWFCGADVAECLGFANTAEAVARHCRPAGITRRTLNPDDASGTLVAFITEPNVYRLAMQSTHPQADRFERWISEEVVPRLHRYTRKAASESVAALQMVSVPVEEYVELLRARVAQLEAVPIPEPPATRKATPKAAPVKSKRRWREATQEELETIRSEWGKTPLLALSRKMDRSRHFVKYQAARLGLFTPRHYLGTGEGVQ